MEAICIGNAVWDIIAQSADPMAPGEDVPGNVVQAPGGVALNVAIALAREGFHPNLLAGIGRDAAGESLITAAENLGVSTAHTYRPKTTPTDRYVAIESNSTLLGAIAAIRCLKASGDAILTPLIDGRLASRSAPYTGIVMLDGNLSDDHIERIARGRILEHADIRVVAASPAKAQSLAPFLACNRATLYLNLEESQVLAGRSFASAATAVEYLAKLGPARTLVTNGAGPAAIRHNHLLVDILPPTVAVKRITGAGDALVAAHIAAEVGGATVSRALFSGVEAAAAHVAGAPHISCRRGNPHDKNDVNLSSQRWEQYVTCPLAQP